MVFVFIVFIYIHLLLYFFLPNDRVHALLADIGKKIKAKPVFDKIIEVDAAPRITIVSTGSNFVFRVL